VIRLALGIEGAVLDGSDKDLLLPGVRVSTGPPGLSELRTAIDRPNDAVSNMPRSRTSCCDAMLLALVVPWSPGPPVVVDAFWAHSLPS
jgi:hypothetical protein